MRPSSVLIEHSPPRRAIQTPPEQREFANLNMAICFVDLPMKKNAMFNSYVNLPGYSQDLVDHEFNGLVMTTAPAFKQISVKLLAGPLNI